MVGLAQYALQTDWRLLLWAEFLIIPVALLAMATAALGRGGPTIAVGVLAVATHAETWLASLQGTVEGDLLAGDTADVLAWVTVGQNGAESVIVLAGVAAVVAGSRLVAVRARDATAPPGTARS